MIGSRQRGTGCAVAVGDRAAGSKSHHWRYSYSWLDVGRPGPFQFCQTFADFGGRTYRGGTRRGMGATVGGEQGRKAKVRKGVRNLHSL